MFLFCIRRPQEPLVMFHQSTQITSDTQFPPYHTLDTTEGPSQQIFGSVSSTSALEKAANTMEPEEREEEEVEEPVRKKKTANAFIIFRAEMQNAIREEYPDAKFRDVGKHIDLVTHPMVNSSSTTDNQSQ